MPVALVPWCVAAPETCEPRSVRDGSSHAAFHSRGRDRPWAEEPEQRRARVLGRFARALLVAPRAPVSPARRAVRSGVPRSASLRPRSPLDAAPRRATPAKGSGCLLPRRNPYASGGLLLRARLDRSPVTPPPKRYCSGTLAPFFEASEAPSPDGESTRSDVTVRTMGAGAPGDSASRCAHHGIYDRISSRRRSAPDFMILTGHDTGQRSW